ncbi:diacylglycerol kinase family protein [Jiulongibacter sediminis]|uniref:diacylglycerol kinase family protein n=1 Tax=Jiulongibacter sediminis TaxID=1605367 RepID=UPI0026EE14FE|nr:diacylglycerol kinase family protein [Jiulongibacter sediminis]
MNRPKMLKSFRYAGVGFTKLLRFENNFQFHALAAVLVLVLSSLSNLARWEWLVVCISIAAVFTAEAFNTAIEKLCDLVSKERLQEIEDIKDIAATGVLLTAVGALIVAFFVFGKRLLESELFTL